MAGSIFYKPKVTFEVPGVHAETRIHGRVEHFFLRLHRGEMDAIDAKMIDVDVALVRAHVQKDRRVLVKENYSGITGKPSERNENEVSTLQSEVGSGEWTEITPSAALEPGEYALVFLPKEKQWNTRFVLDFGIDP